jgi:transcriptional regulator with XRE-family HTH domain
MHDSIDVFLGRRLRKRRRSLGLTQSQVADALGVRFQQIQKYESGLNRIAAARLWALSKALGVPLTYFFDGLDVAVGGEVGDAAGRAVDRSGRFHDDEWND